MRLHCPGFGESGKNVITSKDCQPVEVNVSVFGVRGSAIPMQTPIDRQRLIKDRELQTDRQTDRDRQADRQRPTGR